ncbi:hypothetical protein [Streptomyces cinereoruber]|uniref:hypothetical protein n=1 Tax=Streptomyces cinereoruber TaxID=67260 RepID=UPI0033915B4D
MPEQTTAPKAPARPKRHRWNKIHDHRKTCLDCGMLADQRPHPYARQWWTEWSLGNRNWNTLQGDKTPPCEPAA